MLYFVSVNYYSTELLRALLASVKALHSPMPYRFVIVNNSANDGSLYCLQQEFEQVDILTAPDNLGFGGGCNLGIEYAYQQDSQAWVWLINPDALLVPCAIAYVQACFEAQPSLSILGTRIQAGEGDIWFAQGRFNWWTGSLKHRLSQKPNQTIANNTVANNTVANNTVANTVKVLPSRWVSGCSMIFNLQRFDRPPLFDLNFFLDYEDAEICERYYRQGHEIGVTQAVLVTHAVSAITHRNRRAKFRHATFSKLYFLYRHGSLLALGLNVIYMLGWSVKLLVDDREIGIGRSQGWADFIGWWFKSVTHQLPPGPFRPKTAFTQMQQSVK